MPDISIVARCHPTEELSRVTGAISLLFPDAVFEGADPVSARAESTGAFAEQLARQRIRSAARAALHRGVTGSETFFRLNKQVATVGKISFSEEEHPLGDIEVTIRSDEIRSLIDSMTDVPREDGGR